MTASEMCKIAMDELEEALIRYTARIGDASLIEGRFALNFALSRLINAMDDVDHLIASDDAVAIDKLDRSPAACLTRRRIAEAKALVKLGETTP